jgi:preprotein translocase subunit SecF
VEFFKRKTHIPFMTNARAISAISVVLVLVSIASLALRGLNFGIDFTGGVLLEVGYDGAADLEAVRGQLDSGGFPDAQVQNFGSAKDVLIRLPPREEQDESSGQLGQRILSALQQGDQQVELRRIEFVGPQVGKDLTEQGTLSVLFALGLILVYVMFRFQWKFAVGAVLATFHDAIVTLGVFSVFGLPFDLSVLAAVLAVIGYSLNDTIVVFDRIRDNFRTIRRGTVPQIIDSSINETLSRTINTSGVTLLVVIALLLFGGETLFGFSLALTVGIVFGTYSSIYVASAIAMYLGVSPTDLMAPKKTEEADSTP